MLQRQILRDGGTAEADGDVPHRLDAGAPRSYFSHDLTPRRVGIRWRDRVELLGLLLRRDPLLSEDLELGEVDGVLHSLLLVAVHPRWCRRQSAPAVGSVTASVSCFLLSGSEGGKHK